MLIRKTLVLVIADYYQSIIFFQRLCTADALRDYLFLTSSLSGYIYLKHKRCNAKLMIGAAKLKTCVNVARAQEVLSGITSEASARKYALLALETAQEILATNKRQYDNRIAICWNGSGVTGIVMRQLYALGYVDALRFFELANLPNKIFCDPEGVNAESSLYRTKAIKLAYEPEYKVIEMYNAWRNSFINTKMRVHTVPQRGFGRKLRLGNLIDLIYQTACTPFRYKLKYVIKTAMYKIAKQRIKIRQNSPPDRYVFFPMQTTGDSQILLNSNVDNLQAIELILSKKIEVPLVVKLHPADQSIKLLENMAINLGNRVYFCDDNTFQLIKGAEKVITINSSVGLEALILGKSVEFLGKSFYAFFSANHLVNYIENYLVNADFYGSGTIQPQEIEKIFNINYVAR